MLHRASAAGGLALSYLAGDYTLPDTDEMWKTISTDAEDRRKKFVDSPRHAIEVEVAPYLKRLHNVKRHEGAPKRAEVKVHSWS